MSKFLATVRIGTAARDFRTQFLLDVPVANNALAGYLAHIAVLAHHFNEHDFNAFDYNQDQVANLLPSNPQGVVDAHGDQVNVIRAVELDALTENHLNAILGHTTIKTLDINHELEQLMGIVGKVIDYNQGQRLEIPDAENYLYNVINHFQDMILEDGMTEWNQEAVFNKLAELA